MTAAAAPLPAPRAPGDSLRTEDAVAAYRRDGYAVLAGALPVPQIDSVRAWVHRPFRHLASPLRPASDAALGGPDMLADLQALFAHDLDAYRSAARTAPKLVAVTQALLSESVLGFAQALGISAPSMPSQPVLHIMSDQLRFPGGYHGVPAHQDWPSIKGSADELVIWLPLVDIDTRCFPLQVIPRSHLKGVLPGTIGANATEVDPACYDRDAFVTVEIRRGDVLLLSALTIHRTAPVSHAGLRVAVSTRFDNVDDDLFQHNRYPCAYTRGVQRDLATDRVPTGSARGLT